VRFVRKHRVDETPFAVGEFVAHDSKLQFKSLNHVYADATNIEIRFRYQPLTGRGTLIIATSQFDPSRACRSSSTDAA
jgi:hypothetical protein